VSRNSEKGKRYEFLVKQMDASIASGFYIEAMGIAYAMMEERTYRLLDHLGLSYNPRNDKLYECLKKVSDYIQAQVNTNSNLDEVSGLLDCCFIKNNLCQDIQEWRKKRNDMTHDLAKQTIDYESLHPIAIEGCELFKKYSALIMTVKKRISKAE